MRANGNDLGHLGLLQRFQNGVIQAYAGVAALVVVGLLVVLILT